MKISGLIIVLGALANAAGNARVASAQAVCWALARDLAAQSPRLRLAELSFRGRPDRDVIADATGCAINPDQLVGASAVIGVLPVNVSVQPLTIRASLLGGLADPRANGPMWSGRGLNGFARTGVSADLGWLHLIAAPQAWYAENRSFEIAPSPNPTRSAFASPWYNPPFSIDLPSRFGTTSVTQIDPGESSAWLGVAGVDVGAATSTQRWGPGSRGGIILGADAPGIPRVFVRTSHPVWTRAGAFSATVFAGTLTSSRYFTRTGGDQLRSLTAGNVAWTPSESSAVIVGVGHASMSLGTRFGSKRATQPVRGPSEEINEVYGQFRDPRSGFRAWAEIGRAGRLPSLRGFLTEPYQGVVYVVGIERIIARRRNSDFLVSWEAANLEQPTDIRGVTSQDFYTSSIIPEGWTQRGQVLGYPSGPGSQSQWLSVDWIGGHWSIGGFGERVRWNEDALIRQYLAYPNRHDVTVRGGVRAGLVVLDTELALEASIGHRFSYLFQNSSFLPGYRTADVSVPALRFALTPAAHGRP